MCTCRGCYLLFTAERAELRYRAVPDRYLSFPDFSLGPADWDELQIPVGLAFLFRNSVQDRTVAFYPGPAGATESELTLDAWQRDRRRQPAPGPAAPRRRGAAAARPGPRAPRLSAATSSRSTPATSWSAGCACCGAASTAARRRGPRSTSSSPRSRSAAGPPRRRRDRGGVVTTWTFSVRRHLRRAVRRRPAADRPAADRGVHAARPSTRSRCAARSGSSRSGAHYDEADESGAARPVRRPGPLGRHAASRSCGCSAARWSRASPRSPRSTSRCRAPTTSRSPGRATCTRVGDGRRPAGAAVLRHRVHPGRHRVRRASRCPGTARRRYQLPVAVWRQMIASYFPSTGWIRLDHDVLGGARRLQGARTG